MNARCAGTGLFFAAAALLLTWPLAASPGEAISVRDDYFSNLWNAWWVRRALFELHVSPYFTDALFHPNGVSLARHTLSPLNAFAGAVASFAVSPATAYNLLLWTHFWLSGWAAGALARYETGSRFGGLLAGVIYSFAPIHYFYLPQINVATFEFLPLAALFFLKTHREGGRRNAAGVVACVALLAASSQYFLVYALLFAGLLLISGPLWTRHASAITGARRLLRTAIPVAIVVAAIGWPLLSEVLGETGSATPVRRPAGNDLLGFNWGGVQGTLVSWPTMFGYSALLLAAAGLRGWRTHTGWLLTAGVFWLLGLGASLRIAGTDTGIPLPYGLLAQMPVLEMLRMSNRFFVVAQLAFAVLCAAAWKDASRRWLDPSRRGPWGALVLALVALELSAVPLQTFHLACSRYAAEVADAPDVRTLLELPTYHATSYLNGRYVFCQTIHGKKIPQGYVTTLAVPKDVAEESRSWVRAHRALVRGDSVPLVERVRSRGIDRVVLNKRFSRAVRAPEGRRPVLWSPFFFARRDLVLDRQRGYLREREVPAEALARQIRELSRTLGEPIFEDADVVVFSGRRGP